MRRRDRGVGADKDAHVRGTHRRSTLRHNAGVEELEQLWAEVLVRQVRVLSQYISSKVVVLVLDVKQQQVSKRLRWEGRVLEQEVELAEARGGVIVHVHQRLVVQRHWIQLVLTPWRHVTQGFLGGSWVAKAVLNRSFEVERLHQSCLPQNLGVADASHLVPL